MGIPRVWDRGTILRDPKGFSILGTGSQGWDPKTSWDPNGFESMVGIPKHLGSYQVPILGDWEFGIPRVWVRRSGVSDINRFESQLKGLGSQCWNGSLGSHQYFGIPRVWDLGPCEVWDRIKHFGSDYDNRMKCFQNSDETTCKKQISGSSQFACTKPE